PRGATGSLRRGGFQDRQRGIPRAPVGDGVFPPGAGSPCSYSHKRGASCPRFRSFVRGGRGLRSPEGPRRAARRDNAFPAVGFRPSLEGLECRTLPSTLTVLTNADSGAGSLRALLALASRGDTINPTDHTVVATVDGGMRPAGVASTPKLSRGKPSFAGP